METERPVDRGYMYIVYSNCFNLIKYRGFEPVTAKLELNKFNEVMANTTYIHIKGTRSPPPAGAVDADGGRKELNILMFAPKNKYLQGRVAIKKYMDKNVADGYIIVTATAQPHANIKSIAKESGIYVYTGIYEALQFNYPEHSCYVEHKIASDELIRDFTKYEHRKTSQLPRCFTSDTPVFWIGAKPGNTVLCYRPSMTTFDALYMRKVYDLHYQL